VFEKVIDHCITSEDVEEENDEMCLIPVSSKKTTFKSTFYYIMGIQHLLIEGFFCTRIML